MEKERKIRIEVPEGLELSESEIDGILEQIKGELVHSASRTSALALLEVTETRPKSKEVTESVTVKEIAKQTEIAKSTLP